MIHLPPHDTTASPPPHHRLPDLLPDILLEFLHRFFPDLLPEVRLPEFLHEIPLAIPHYVPPLPSGVKWLVGEETFVTFRNLESRSSMHFVKKAHESALVCWGN